MNKNQEILLENFINEMMGMTHVNYGLETWGKAGADAIRKDSEQKLPRAWKETKYLTKKTWQSIKEDTKEFAVKLDNYIKIDKKFDMGLKDDIYGEVEKFWVLFSPKLARSLLELEVEIYSQRWISGYLKRHKEIRSKKKMDLNILRDEDKAKQQGYYYREFLQKNDKRLITSVKNINKVAVETALKDYDKDLVSDVLDEAKNKFFNVVNLKRYYLCAKYTYKQFGKVGLGVSILEIILLVFAIISLIGFFKELLTAHVITAFAGLVVPLGKSDVLNVILDKLKETTLKLLGKDVEGYARSLKFVSENIKPVEKDNLQLVKYEKINGVTIPSTGKIDFRRFNFDFEKNSKELKEWIVNYIKLLKH